MRSKINQQQQRWFAYIDNDAIPIAAPFTEPPAFRPLFFSHSLFLFTVDEHVYNYGIRCNLQKGRGMGIHV